ncbi:ABC transporter permease subunit [Sinorhizobium garamanticum]|uniref:ABC transporter permease subunit n=1 Tax=Sinorhizobium garamanticum TaxID=680247 RepID=A0ABY8D4K1_9HYPH|nr:ABC transporter permease subunit [Sinorhizobium garamanticum]WEX85786.1 ABC transporter permease subunit [Sinorhizobium garamanticum]
MAPTDVMASSSPSRLLTRRLLPFVPALSRATTLTAVLILVGLLPWLSGRDPALSILRARSGEQEATPEALAAIRRQLGLDLGPIEKLRTWLLGLLEGDAGTSWISGAPVLPGMLNAAQVSLTLMACAMLVAATTAALLCSPTMHQGLRGNLGRSSGAAGAALTALPEFLLSSILLVVFAAWLKWFPPYGWRGPVYAVLPALALGLPAGGLLGRLFSDGLSATFSERWVATWSVAGFPRWRIALAVFRRTLPSLMPQVGMVMVGLTGGAIAVEQVFSIPGLGRATLGAASAQDLPALQTGILILLAIAVFLGSMANIGRALLLGRALELGALPVPRADSSAYRPSWVVPAVVGAMLLVLIAAGLGRDPFTSAFVRLQPPSLALPLGADGIGRDILARVGHGALSTIGMALVVVFLSLTLGLAVGMAPRLAAGPIEITKGTPPIIAGLVVAGIIGPSASGAMIAVTAVAWAPLAAHTAALVSEVMAQPHVRITPILGVGRMRLMSRYVLPAVAGPVFRHAMLRLPGTALALAALGFLGLGPRPPSPEWGLVLAEGMPYLERAPWAVLIPTLALVLLSVLAVSLSGFVGTFRRRRTTR